MSSKKLTRRSLLSAALTIPVIAAVTGCAQEHTAMTGPYQSTSQSPKAVEHLVIGTGYGGAVAAYRLAMAGHHVTMLEMGQRWSTPGHDGKVFPTMLKPDWRAMWYRDRTQLPLATLLGIDINKKIGMGPGVLDRRSLGEMSVYLGRGVGGGSLVNGGMSPRPRRDVFARQLPKVDVDEFFKTYLPRAEQRLGISIIDPEFKENTPWYQFSRTGRRDAQEAGYSVVDVPNNYDFEYMKSEAAGTVPPSALNAEVVFGNNHGKRDLTKTYLGRAEATGNVKIQTMTEVLTIRPATGGYLVETQVRRFDGTMTSRPSYLAKRVYLGAGSIGTTEILLRSAEQGYLKDLPSQLGRGWGPNGNTMFARANHLWRPTGCHQSTIPIMGVDHWESDHPCFTEIAPMPAGVDLFMQLYLSIADNQNQGTLSLNDDQLTLDWVPEMSDSSVAKAKATFDRINRQQGTIYRTDLFGNGESFSRNFTYHPLGGTVLGQATDDYGRIPGYSGLYVTDGSLIPQIIGVNPYLTITALAERLMDQVLTHDLG